jgi:UDP-N-acetylglucosamine acyltransferase
VIDPRAVVDPTAQVASDVDIGAYSIVGADVEVGSGTWIGPHVVVQGPTRIGRDNRIFQFASIGEIPQDRKSGGEVTRLEIGDRNTIREYCTINRGTAQDAGVTRIGDDNWIMAYVHIAHDCVIGNSIVFANSASLAGHVEVGDYSVLGGFVLVHQFCSIGAHSFCAMGSGIIRDVPPYVLVAGNPAHPRGINHEGLRRCNFDADTILAVRRAYKLLYRSNLPLGEALMSLRDLAKGHEEVGVMADFLERSRRSVIR